MKNILDCKTREEFRMWLCENHDSQSECWMIAKKGRNVAKDCVAYVDAVEEALCFGWIDTTHKAINGVDMQKFTPRSKNTVWSELNKERCRRLEKLGLMTDAGRAVLPDMDIDRFEIDEEIVSAFEKCPNAWENFKKFPPLYQRVRIDTIQRDKKKDKAVFEKRIEKLIEYSSKNETFGEWNDNGRLLEY